MKTSKSKLEELKAKKDKTDKEYFAYLKQYNEEHGVKRGHLVKEIIGLHKKGKSNKEIAELGYNRNYVNQQVAFFKKGKRTAKTPVARFLTSSKKK